MGHVIFSRFLITKSHYFKRNMSVSYFNFHLSFETSCDVQIAVCIDIFQILFITTFHRKFYRWFVYFEDTVTYFDKIVMFFHGGGGGWGGEQIDILKFIQL